MVDHAALMSTYDHRSVKTGHPVRYAIPEAGVRISVGENLGIMPFIWSHLSSLARKGISALIALALQWLSYCKPSNSALISLPNNASLKPFKVSIANNVVQTMVFARPLPDDKREWCA